MAIQLDDLVARLRLDTAGVEQGMSRVSGALSSAGASATNAGKNLSIGVTAPLAGIAAASVNLAAKFETTMAQVGIATGGATDSLSKLAMQMGAETAFSAGEAADAMLELAKGGMTAAQIEGGALAATMKLASAGGVGLAESSTYVSNAMATFGLRAKDADSVTVALAGAANASSASVESLGMGLAQGALAARNAGLSLQETTGVLSLFDAAGLKGADAGTSLKSALNSLIPTTEKARGTMEDLGLDFVKGNGAFESVSNIAGQLQSKLGGLSEAQRSLALETLFGSDGMRAATILMNEGAEGVRKYTAASRDQKTTTELANAAMSGTAGAIERAKGSIETVGLLIGQQLAPFVERAAGVIELLAGKFVNLPGPMQGVAVALAAVAAAAGPLLIALGFIATGLAAVSLPVVGVVAGLTALGGALVAAYTHSSTFRAAVQTALGAVASFITGQVVPAAQRIGIAFQGLVAVVLPIVLQIAAVVRQHMPAIAATVQQAFATVKSIILAVMTVVRTVITTATAVIQAVWDRFGDRILSTVSKVFPAVLAAIRGALRVIQGVVDVFVGVLTGDWSRLWSGVQRIVTGAWQIVSGVVRAGTNAVAGILGALGSVIAGIATSAWNAFTGAVRAGIGKSLDVVRELPGRIKAVFAGLPGVLTAVGQDVIRGLVAGLESAKQWVIDKIQEIADVIPGWVKKRLGIASLSKVMKELGRHISDGMVKGIEGTRGDVRAAMDGVISTLREANKNGLTKLAVETQNKLLKWASKYESVTKALDEQRAKLQQLNSDARQLAESVRGAVVETGNLSDVTARTDAEGNELPITYDDVIGKLTTARDRATAFNATMAQLRTLGLSTQSIDDLANAGPAALEEAQAILSGGAAAVAQVNALTAQIANAGTAVAQLASSNMYAAGIAVAGGLIAGLESRGAVIEAVMERIAGTMVKTIKKKLKVKSPSRVLETIGAFTGEGFALGIDGTARAVAAASDRMAAAAIVQPPRIDAATVGTGALQRLAFDRPGAVGGAAPEVRVFIGERELTDLVRVEVGGALRPVRTAIRQGVI